MKWNIRINITRSGTIFLVSATEPVVHMKGDQPEGLTWTPIEGTALEFINWSEVAAISSAAEEEPGQQRDEREDRRRLLHLVETKPSAGLDVWAGVLRLSKREVQAYLTDLHDGGLLKERKKGNFVFHELTPAGNKALENIKKGRENPKSQK